MVPARRVTVFVLVLACLIGWPSQRAFGDDLFPMLGLLPEARSTPPQHTEETDSPRRIGSVLSDAADAPRKEVGPPRAFESARNGTLVSEIRTPPDVQFELAPDGLIGGTLSPAAEDVWEESGWVPARRGLLEHQPLRQHLRSLYGPSYGRHRGLGRPFTNESWLYRPFSAGWFMGAMFGSPLIDDWLGTSSGYFTGFRFGWDQNYYWGLDMQFAYGQVGLWDSASAKQQRRLWYVDQGWLADDPSLDRLMDSHRDLELYQWAVSVMYYPWGDARWRPYLSIGIGAANIKFTDIFLVSYNQTYFVLPLAAGVKYHWNDWLALRIECSDSFSIPGGGGLEAIHNLSINGAFEIRFGGSRNAYWPWNPGRRYW